MAKLVLINVPMAPTRGIYRQLWVARAGDIVVTPIPIDDVFFRYVCDTLGFGPDAIAVVTRDELLTDDHLVRTDLVSQLRDLTAGSTLWELMPSIYTEGVAELAELLGMDIDVGLRFAAQRGPELLNRKSHFRQLAAGAGLPIADGSVVANARALAKAIENHLPQTGTVIVKRDNDMGGRGNVTLTKKAAVPLPGSRETRSVDGDIPAVAAKLWDELVDERNHVVVVESYHDAASCFYFEYLIDATGRPDLVDSGTFRRRASTDPGAKGLVWVGLELPAELSPFVAAKAAALSTRIVDLAAQAGYRGYVNVDAIITDSGDIVFNEINARWGGGLALHHLAERLLGERYAQSHVVSGARDVTPVPLDEALGLLDRHGLHVTADSTEGVVILGYDPLLERTMECVIIGRSRQRSREIEAKLRKVADEAAARR